MDTVSDALKFMRARSLSDAMRDREQRNKMMLDAARGGLMGVTTDVLGYPVDLMTTALRPFGYNVEKPVGGSDWLADKLTNPTGSVAETAGRVATGMLTPGPEDMLRMAGVLRPKAPVNELTTYHGSPHRINNVTPDAPYGKFDLSKVGTGEGAQAYGHGIYLAQSPGVAKAYQANLARDPRDEINAVIHDLSRRSGSGRVTQSVDELAAELSKNPIIAPLLGENPSLVQDIRKLAYGYDGSSHTDEALAAARRLDAILPQGKGHFYTVDLPDEHIAKMLDWDAPLSEQPEAVRAQINALLDSGTLDPASVKAIRDYDSPGSVIYKMIASDTKAAGEAMDAYPGARGASERLRSLGIPGIKYFDGGSRAAGEGTRNFVIFDPDIAKILKRE